MKKVLALFTVLVLILSFAGCKGEDPTVDISNSDASEVEVEAPKFSINPLTGVADLEIGKENIRPVAVMINNIRIAQKVQTGVQNADIIYETEVEGGITRLMAVYKDISKASQIGTVRSARYAYIDLALGHDAVYVHCGIDMTYAQPHVKSSGVTSFNINSNPWASYGFREKNGLASEHTMYTSSEKLTEGFKALDIRTTTDKPNTFCEFYAEGSEQVPNGGSAYKVTVPFSSTATSIFTYNEENKKYAKNTKGTANSDYKTGEAYEVTNVFVLQTSITNYSDGYHRNISLTGGNGYYFSNGGYSSITWKKAGENQPIQYFAADGTELKVNAGKSWVCIQNSAFNPVIEGSADAE